MATKKFLALSGGVGGAKLALGLSKLLEASELSIIAEGDDEAQAVDAIAKLFNNKFQEE